MLKVLDLFSGIGGFSLGLERTGGFETVAFCEINDYCQSVLRKHWPHIPIYSDITQFKGQQFYVRPDLICGGFPCQDISAAGYQEGITGQRSGLWFEMRRVIGELRPRWILIENVASLKNKGADEVLTGLEAIGYTCWPTVVGAWAVGAPHNRERVWILGYSKYNGQAASQVAPSHAEELSGNQEGAQSTSQSSGAGQTGDVPRSLVADSGSEGLQGGLSGREDSQRQSLDGYPRLGGSGLSYRWPLGRGARQHDGEAPRLVRLKSELGGAVDGISHELDANRDKRLIALGNAVLPQIPELFGTFILEIEHGKTPD